jgi:hypothetical protein
MRQRPWGRSPPPRNTHLRSYGPIWRVLMAGGGSWRRPGAKTREIAFHFIAILGIFPTMSDEQIQAELVDEQIQAGLLRE